MTIRSSRSALASAPRRSRVLALSLSLSLALVLVLAGCTVSTDESDARPIDPDIAELLTPTPTPTPSESVPLAKAAVTWLKGGDYVRTTRMVPAQTRQDELDHVLVELIVAGPRATELRRGLETAIPPGLVVDGTVGGDRVVLDVPDDSQFEPGGVEAAVGQLAVTALSLPGVVSVRFSIDGDRTAVPVPDERKPQRIVTLSDYRSVLRR